MTDNYSVSRQHDWPLPVFALVLVCSVVGCAWFSIIATPDKTTAHIAAKTSITPSHIDTTSQEDPAPVGMIAAANIGQTLTPFQPVANTPGPSEKPKEVHTQTPEPTHTPYPTFTHTAQLISDNVENTPIIRYEEIEKIVTVVVVETVEVLVTPHATPTPQPTPDYRATQSALTTAAAKRAGQWETIAIWTVAFTISVLAGIVLVVIVRAMWEWLTSPKVQVNETREEIIAPAMSPVEGVTAAELDQVRLMKAQGLSQTAMERFVSMMRGKEYTGGAIHGQIKAALEYLESVP